MNIQRTVIWIKPDAFRAGDQREKWSELKLALPDNPEDFIEEVRSALQDKDLELISEHQTTLSEKMTRAHYVEFADVYSEEFWENKQDFLAWMMTSWPSHWFLCEWEDAIKRWREVISSIRNKYLIAPKDARYNMTHWSGNIEEAQNEVRLHFSDFK